MKNNGFVEKLIASHHSRTEWIAVLDLDPMSYILHHIDDFLQN